MGTTNPAAEKLPLKTAHWIDHHRSRRLREAIPIRLLFGSDNYQAEREGFTIDRSRPGLSCSIRPGDLQGALTTRVLRVQGP